MTYPPFPKLLVDYNEHIITDDGTHVYTIKCIKCKTWMNKITMGKEIPFFEGNGRAQQVFICANCYLQKLNEVSKQ